MNKRAMISQPMAGKTDEEIAETRDRAHAKLREMGYEFVNTLFTDEWYSDEAMERRGVVQIPLCYLAKSLENMSLCHVAYFCKGWENADAASSMMPPLRTGLRCCMRISDEKRREIAEEIRSKTLCTRGSLGDWWMRLHEAVTNEEDFPCPPETMAAIADLIDRPTCEMTREGEGFRCSACGAFHDMSGFEKFPWPYCPNCGAEVRR